jgi:hypothetical protein
VAVRPLNRGDGCQASPPCFLVRACEIRGEIAVAANGERATRRGDESGCDDRVFGESGDRRRTPREVHTREVRGSIPRAPNGNPLVTAGFLLARAVR